MRDEKIRALFLSSPVQSGADTWVHYLVLRHLDSARVERYAAGQRATSDTPSPAFDELRAIPGVTVRATNFGHSLTGKSKLEKARSALHTLPAAASLVGLASYVRRHRIQVLHSTDRPRDAMACAALSSLTGARSVIHVHVKYGDWMSKGVRWAFSRAHALIGVSNFVARSLVEGGYPSDAVHAVPNAIDPSAWNPELDRTPGRRVLGVDAAAPLVVSVARLFSWKGHAELISAIAAVKRELPSVRLAIVGADYPPGSGASAKLEAQARELGVAENVVFAGHRNDIASLLAASDVFALPSFEEPFGLVFAEAMAMKRPVVALDNGGTPEVVTDGKTGLLSRPGDIAGLSSNLSRLLADPSLRARLGEAGRRDVETRFTPTRLASDVLGVYSSLLGKPDSRMGKSE